MKNILLLLAIFTFSTASAQLQIKSIDYKVLASAQKDSAVAQFGEDISIKEPNYMGGSYMDLVNIATAVKKTAPRWSSYTVGDQSMERYTFKIEITLGQ